MVFTDPNACRPYCEKLILLDKFTSLLGAKMPPQTTRDIKKHNKTTPPVVFSDFIRFVMIWEGMLVKSAPKLSPRGAKDRQSDPKVTQKGSKGTPNGPQRHSKYTENAPKEAQEVFS